MTAYTEENQLALRAGLDARHTHDVARQVSALTLVALVGVTYFAVAVVVLHPLRPDFDPARRFISEFAIGPYSGVMAAAFFALAAGSLALALAFWRAAEVRSRLGSALLAIFGAAILIDGIFPVDLQYTGQPKTTAGTIHDQSSLLAFLSVMAAMLVLSYRLRRRWPSWYVAAMVLAVAAVVEFCVLYLAIGAGWPGWPQRVYAATIVAWLLLAAARLRRDASGATMLGH